MYKKGAGNDKQRKDAGNRTLCPYRNFSQAINTFTNHTKYKFCQTDREVFESTLENALGSADFSGHLSTSDLDYCTLTLS